MTKDSLGDRMKRYEHAQWHVLPDRLPVILRVDGRAFHTYTRDCDRPFDDDLILAMNKVAVRLCQEVGGAQLAYVQSDEVSLLVHGYKRHASQAWFRGEVQKIVSIAASVASATMTMKMAARLGAAHFDARVFVLPEHDVCNYFVWRQKDWMRNSVQMAVRAHYSQKDCHQAHVPELCEMLRKVGHPWEDLSNHLRLGRVATRVTERRPTACLANMERHVWQIAEETPLFTEQRDFIERFLPVENEEPGEASPTDQVNGEIMPNPSPAAMWRGKRPCEKCEAPESSRRFFMGKVFHLCSPCSIEAARGLGITLPRQETLP